MRGNRSCFQYLFVAALSLQFIYYAVRCWKYTKALTVASEESKSLSTTAEAAQLAMENDFRNEESVAFIKTTRETHPEVQSTYVLVGPTPHGENIRWIPEVTPIWIDPHDEETLVMVHPIQVYYAADCYNVGYATAPCDRIVPPKGVAQNQECCVSRKRYWICIRGLRCYDSGEEGNFKSSNLKEIREAMMDAVPPAWQMLCPAYNNSNSRKKWLSDYGAPVSASAATSNKITLSAEKVPFSKTSGFAMPGKTLNRSYHVTAGAREMEAIISGITALDRNAEISSKAAIPQERNLNPDSALPHHVLPSFAKNFISNAVGNFLHSNRMLTQSGKNSVTSERESAYLDYTYTMADPSWGDLLIDFDASEIARIDDRPVRPYKFALLALTKGKMTQKKVWDDWTAAARTWSQEMFNHRAGPFSGFDEIGHDERNLAHSNTAEVYHQKRLLAGDAVKIEDEEFEENLVAAAQNLNQEGNYFGSPSEKMPVTSGPQVWPGKFFDSNESLLSVYSHVSVRGAGRQRARFLPVDFQKNVVPFTKGKWGDLNAIQYQLLKSALADPHNAGFAFISDSSVPLKPFSYIYESFFEAPRSRFSFSHIEMPFVDRKHHQWVVLNRRHATALVRNPHLWVCGQWATYHQHNRKRVAAPDEYLPFLALNELYGPSTLQEQINSGTVFRVKPHPSSASLMNGSYVEKRFKHTVVSWDRIQCWWFGKCVHDKKLPLKFYELRASSLQKMIQRPESWFLRKVVNNCTVRHYEDEHHQEIETLADFMRKAFKELKQH